jgi:hypothetical protein
VHQIGGEGFDARTVLDRLGDLLRKGDAIGGATGGTGAGGALVFGDFQRKRRQFQDLTTLDVCGEDAFEGGSTALTYLGAMHDDDIGGVRKLQSASGMALLASGGTAALVALGLGVGFLEAIGGRGLAGVVAVLAETVFELLDAQGQERDGVLERGEHLKDGVGSLIVESLELFACEHVGLYEACHSKIPDLTGRYAREPG